MRNENTAAFTRGRSKQTNFSTQPPVHYLLALLVETHDLALRLVVRAFNFPLLH